MNKIQHYLDFLEVWNNCEDYPTAYDVADALGTNFSSVTSKAKRYRYLLQRKPELELPPILDRNKVTKDGLTYTSHDIQINSSVKLDPNKKRFLITCAQYGADVNEELLNTFKGYCKHNNAQLIVAPVRYGVSHDAIGSVLNDFVTYKGLRLGKHVEINLLGITPTIMNPLVGLARYASKRSQIFPHPQIATEFIPRSNINLPKAIMTTGSITYPLYGFNKASEQAEFEHRFGAVVVELDGDNFHFRHVIADTDGSFCDVIDGYSYYFDGDKKEAVNIDALDCGDWHTGDTCPKVRDTTYSSIVPNLKPEYILKHDFFDGRSISHHDERSGIVMAQKALSGRNSLKRELDECADELEFIKDKASGAKVMLVASNHIDHLDQYIAEGRYVKDWLNLAEATGIVADRIMTDKPAFEIAMLKRNVKGITFMKRDEDFHLHGIKLDLHGDVGCNGAKGSAASFDRIGLKCVVGHMHTPSIKRNVFTIGTSTHLKLGYTRGLTSWVNTHAIIYKTGQVQHINIIGGKWHG